MTAVKCPNCNYVEEITWVVAAEKLKEVIINYDCYKCKTLLSLIITITDNEIKYKSRKNEISYIG